MTDFQTLTVATSEGSVTGRLFPDGSSNFRGIPYAEPPIGDQRFVRSVKHAGWKESLDCTEFRAGSLQNIAQGGSVNELYPGGLNESCLHLNIWMPPSSSTRESLPVFIWIHGGGFMVGSGSEPIYDGTKIASEGVIVVTINYRLGALGFMWTEEGDANCGLWDQVRALQWVQENISNFGGDPNRVTIGGESAGAGCVTCLAASPLANRYFQSALIMSAVAHTTDDQRTASLRASQFATALGAASIHVDDLKNIDVAHMLGAQSGEYDKAPVQDVVTAHNTPGWQGPLLRDLSVDYKPAEPDGIHYIVPGSARNGPMAHGFFPAVDGELLPEHPLDAIARGAASHLQLIVGSNREENGFRPDPNNPEASAPMTYGARTNTLAEAVKRCRWFFMGMGRLDDLGGSSAVAEELVSIYSQEEGQDAGAAASGSAQHVWNRLASDMAFGASTVMLAARQASFGPDKVWTYRFDGFNNRNAFHGWELGLMFGTLVDERNPETQRLAVSLRGSFCRFIKSGNPNGQVGVPPWQSWLETDVDLYNGPVMHFDRSRCHVDGYLKAAPGIGAVVGLLDHAFFHQAL